MMTQPPRRRRRTSQQTSQFVPWHDYLRRLGLLPMLALTALAAPFIPAPPGSIHWHGAQTVCTEVGAVLLLMALLCHPWRLSSLTAFGLNRWLPFVFLYLLFLWGLVSCLLSPTPFAVQGLLLLGVGVLTAAVTAAHLTDTRRILFAALIVLLPAALTAMTGLAQFGDGTLPIAVGVLHDHMLFGAFISLVIPLSLALCLSPVSLLWRTCGQATLGICQVALIAAQTRSSWIGEAAALLLFGGLVLWVRADRVKKAAAQPARAVRVPNAQIKTTAVSVAAVLVVGVIFFITLPDRDTLTKRVQTLTTTVTERRDVSVEWRFSAWEGARAMIRQKPLFGWGIGSYARDQFSFTHVGQEAAVVQAQGPTIFDETHNSYLQIWAELGIVGLLLWLGAFFSLIGSGVQSLHRQVPGSLEEWLLIGGVSAVAGQMTDALANPAWQFGNVLLPLWIVFGLTSALSAPRGAIQPPPARPLLWRIAQYGFAAGLGVWLLSLIWRTAFALPAPHL